MTEPVQRKIFAHYKNLERQFDTSKVEDRVAYISPVNFNESMLAPRHRWFPYKEGFSPSFVSGFIAEHSAKSNGYVLDPFCGVGTAPIVAGMNGVPAIGFDISPLAIFAATTKAINRSDFSESELLAIMDKFRKDALLDIAPPPSNVTVASYFDEQYLGALLRVKCFISHIGTPLLQALFKLAFLSIIEQFSTHRKTGNGVKRKTRQNYGLMNFSPLDEIKCSIVHVLNDYVHDLRLKNIPMAPQFCKLSGIEDSTYDSIDDISTVLTSPPYANCFDYSKIYLQELWLGDFFNNAEDQKEFRKASVRSHVHATWSERHFESGLPIINNEIREYLNMQKMWSNKIADMLSGYFKDLGHVMQLLKPKLTKNAVLGFVVSNSFYGGVPIATDLLLGELGQRNGFAVESIRIYRKIIPSSQQYRRINDKKYMRESLVILRNH